MSLQYLIDGYNLINHPLFQSTHKDTVDSRLALLALISIKRLTGSSKNRITVVFDGYPATTQARYVDSNINVIFSRKISADDKIKNIVEESANRRNIVVVSDDKEIKFMVRALGARSMGVEEFINAKEKSKSCQKKDLLKPELNYSQIHEINQELSKIWLKP
jgi:predicted RNA-binding protein with PIN domain